MNGGKTKVYKWLKYQGQGRIYCTQLLLHLRQETGIMGKTGVCLSPTAKENVVWITIWKEWKNRKAS